MERFDYGLLQQYDRLPAGRGAGDQPGHPCSTRLGVEQLLDTQLQSMSAILLTIYHACVCHLHCARLTCRESRQPPTRHDACMLDTPHPASYSSISMGIRLMFGADVSLHRRPTHA